MKPYDPTTFEKKWQQRWKDERLFQGTAAQAAKDKFYALFAFAYPSGSGLHVGHVESMTALDILVRTLRMTGKNVFFPVGWDAFGLPAENYAIKTGVHPAKTTIDAIHTFETQVQRLGASYDWDSEIATCHPEYYKWTQWIFTKLFDAGLAYRDKGWVNWCPQDKTVLANEQVVEGKCERCGSPVIQKELEQWKFRITAYQDELLSGLDQVDWPKSTKEQQKHWIGKSKGLQINFKLQISDSKNLDLPVWTKFWETVYGVTFVVIAPEKFKEMNLIASVPQDRKQQVETYLDAAFHKTEEQRRIGEKDKTGVNTGLTLISPVNGSEVPLYIADYVLMGVGTAIVMGVPAHDERDFAFAKKYRLPCIQVVSYEDKALDARVKAGEISHEGEGVLVNSGEFDGFSAWGEGKEKMAAWMVREGFAQWQTTYKMRDWLISRQRYWGAPIPMVYCEACAKQEKGEKPDMPGWYAVSEDQLPVLLPDVQDFKPTDDGHSPLEKASEDWKYTVCPGCGGKAKREVDTMDTFVDSSWYYLRYTDARNKQEFASKDQMQKWLPVDMYLIGPEHIVLHLLYSRFFTKFLRDQGYLTFDEPFLKMRHQGMILGPDGHKMSKSKGNVISPDEIIEKFGADTLRIYEMFMGPLDADKAWEMSALAGVYRFLTRIHTLVTESVERRNANSASEVNPVRRKLHWAMQKVGQDVQALKFNTSIAALMEFLNVWESEKEGMTEKDIEDFVKVLAPFAPFLSEELWQTVLGKTTSVHLESWPSVDASLLESITIEVVVQVNGKLKDKLTVPVTKANDQQFLEQQARESAKIQMATEGKAIRKVVVIPGKLVNLVV